MRSSDDYNVTLATAFLFIGQPGMGKTTFAMRFPKPYIFDSSNNMAGAVRKLRKEGVTFGYDIGTIDDNNVEIPVKKRYDNMIKRINDAVAAKNPDGTRRFETIILDDATTINDFIIDHVLDTRVIAKDDPGPDTMRIQDWGVYLRRWTALITKLRATGVTAILTCHEKKDTNDEGAVEYMVNLSGQIQGKIGGWFSDVYRFEVVKAVVKDGMIVKIDPNDKDAKPVYACRTKPTQRIALKNSLDHIVPGIFPSDNFSFVAKALAEGKGKITQIKEAQV